jgi:hypothetical protein
MKKHHVSASPAVGQPQHTTKVRYLGAAVSFLHPIESLVIPVLGLDRVL